MSSDDFLFLVSSGPIQHQLNITAKHSKNYIATSNLVI